MYLYKAFFDKMFTNLFLIKTQIFDKSINTLFSKVIGNVTIVKHGINNTFVLITHHFELFKPNKLA
jgi:hypothetical protein